MRGETSSYESYRARVVTGETARDEPQYRSNTEKSDVLTDKSLYYRRKAIGSLVGRDCMVVAFVGSRGPIPSLQMPFTPEMDDW